MINYGKHFLDKKDIINVVKVLKSNNLTQGNEVLKFEENFKKYVGSKFSTSFNSCTSALVSACLVLGLKKNDIVWTTANSFVASANCALICGAKVSFLDINKFTLNMDLDVLEKKLKNTNYSKRPKLIISVHFAGLPNNQLRIWKLSKKYNFKIIEDCCHTLGGKVGKIMMGSAKRSDISVFSFHPVKAMTTGEGGMATTNNKKLIERLNLYKTHGITKEKKKFQFKTNNLFHYEQQLLGYNFRMTDIQAALGNSQLKKLNKFIKLRNSIANNYNKNFVNLPIQTPNKKNSRILHAFHLYVIRFKRPKYRNALYKYLLKRNIRCAFHYIPIYKHPYYKNIQKYKNLPEIEKYYKDGLSLPIYPSLKKKNQNKIIYLIKRFFKNA